MTHTLHRSGTPESLRRDYPVMILRAVGFNDEGFQDKCREFLRIAVRHHPVNLASEMKGNIFEFSLEEILADAAGDSYAVFVSNEDLIGFLIDLREADLGLSVVVSGDFEVVQQCLEAAGLRWHTANFSLGIIGRTDLLPDEGILDIVTMCGHGMVPARLVKKMVDEIHAGRTTPEAAANLLARNCTCGVFNPVRAAELLAKC